MHKNKASIFKRINGFYSYLELILSKVKKEYPILESSDITEKEDVANRIVLFMKTFEQDILSLKETDTTYEDWRELFIKYVDLYGVLEMDYPVLLGFRQALRPNAAGMLGPGASPTIDTASLSYLL